MFFHTLLDRARAIMIGSALPKSAWAEALNAACFLRNPMPCSAVDGGWPYELFWGKAASLLD
jgi:hypothetical protein